MKDFPKKLLLIALLFSASFSYAQRPIWLGVTTSHINFETSKYFNGDYHNVWGPSRIFVGIPVIDKVRIMPSLQLSQKIDFDLDVVGAYSFLEGKRFNPYVVAGGGIMNAEDNTRPLFTAGIGLNLWLTEGFGINAQTNWDAPKDLHPYIQNNLGIIFKLGGQPRDSDKDGVPDERDACPKQAGTAATQGCPDSDGDGIPDTTDACPNEPGTSATQGCPDSDGDGIANANDECPTVAGTEAFKGCPDSDGDGIQDKLDACPNEKGTAQFNGCPDSDNDGIADKDDSCPTEAGTAAMKGCPDKDGDGVTDQNDQCPNEAGVPANNGCPEIKADEIKAIETKLNIAAKRIQFETGSAKIKPVSYAEIDQIVTIMNQYNFTHFDIEGHTDNTGKIETNRTLSQERADAVKNYILSKGVASDRLHAVGYGPDKPIASNGTTAGRAQNRRVEIHLKQ